LRKLKTSFARGEPGGDETSVLNLPTGVWLECVATPQDPESLEIPDSVQLYFLLRVMKFITPDPEKRENKYTK